MSDQARKLESAAIRFAMDHGPLSAANSGDPVARARVGKQLKDILEAHGFKLTPIPQPQETFWILRSGGGRFFESGNEYEYDFGTDRSRAHQFTRKSEAEAWLKNLKRDYPYEGWEMPSSR